MSERMYEVTEPIEDAHPLHSKYPLLPGDLLTRDENDTWMKECPGIAVYGFVLTDEQVSKLRPRLIDRHGLVYTSDADRDVENRALRQRARFQTPSWRSGQIGRFDGV